ncbi:MAG: DNA primase [Planctomycetota bacterium]|nr:MAG: DNA primase [Planctomycetota bacterium]
MAGLYNQTIVSQVQQANDIVDVIGEHISLAKKGKEMVGLCPFHEDHRPSLYVNSAKQIYKCFACGAGGDVFKFLQMRENLSFPQAIERLAERVAIKLPARAAKDQTTEHPADVDPNELARVNEWAAKYFQKNLTDEDKGKNTRHYIAQRKITPQSVKKWRLGLAVANGDLLKAAKKRKIPTKLLEQAGLIVAQMGTKTFGDKFANRLMFPITDVTGRVIAFGGRALDDRGAKYINSPTTALFDKSNSLYGLQQARHHIVSTGLAIVVEGYTDCIMAHQCGCENVVASLGTSFTAGHGRILRRYAKKVVLVFDSDTAGVEAANRALEVCVSQRIDIKLASVPQAKDPCDFLLTDGKEPFDQLVEDAVDVFRFKWNRLIEAFGTERTLVDNKAAIEEFLQTVAAAVWSGKLPAIDRGLIVNRLSKIIATDAKEINAELAKRIKTAARVASYPDTILTKNQKVQSLDLGSGFFAEAQREILEVLLNEPKLFEIVKPNITAELFEVPILKQIATILFKMLNRNPDVRLADILAAAESVEEGSVIVDLAHAGEQKANFKSRLTGALDAVKRYQAQERKSRIKATEDQTKFLRRVSENTEKENPHSLGMV